MLFTNCPVFSREGGNIVTPRNQSSIYCFSDKDADYRPDYNFTWKKRPIRAPPDQDTYVDFDRWVTVGCDDKGGGYSRKGDGDSRNYGHRTIVETNYGDGRNDGFDDRGPEEVEDILLPKGSLLRLGNITENANYTCHVFNKEKEVVFNMPKA